MVNSILVLAGTLLVGPVTATEVPSPKFTAQVVDGGVAIGYGVAIGDVDGDGHPDILLADQKQIAWYRNGNWKKFVMAADLTPRDNVCIAARDINGDSRVEVAVGANWNPGQTSDPVQSGAVYYLSRPADPTQPWQPIKLHHEPTVHRMAWLKGPGGYQLLVLPLHGRGNKNGEGAGARALAYDIPADPHATWTTHLVDGSMHVTHNFDLIHWEGSSGESVLLGGREGIALVTRRGDGWSQRMLTSGEHGAASEVRAGKIGSLRFLAAIEPWHGNTLVVYRQAAAGQPWERTVLADDLGEGHGLACADLLGLGSDQIVVGWRKPNAGHKVGIRLFVSQAQSGLPWRTHVIDDNRMACEDLKVAELDGDGRPDIVASGRATHNLIIYWNKTEAGGRR